MREKYLYKPYHPWRHRFRRERIRKWFFRLLWLVLLWEMSVIIPQYVHMETTERIVSEEERADDVYGIGVSPEKGEVFWFRRKTESRN
ncbi:MAG: hypothetical protein IJO55_04945 [Lachnospiraceae bacterium]|nr:hypothetical protein [Lachnospiraceae bacterium]